MAATNFDLGALLGPIECATFFRDYWEVQPLHVARGEPSSYAGLLSTADVEQVIAFTRPKFVDSGAFSGAPPRARTFVQGWLPDRQLQEGAKYPGLDEIQRVYDRGMTVILMTMQQRWAPIAALCRGLEAAFRCPVHANLYLTPAGAQGFDAHFDTHEVFVLQLEGSKQWRLYGAPRPLPLVDEKLDVPKDRLGPPREVRLEAGDLLYLPRGFVHEAFTSEEASMHLTVGVNVYRWADLLGEALAAVTREDPRFRESLPREVLGSSGVTGAVRERFAELLDALAARARVEEAVRGLGDQFFGQLTPLPGNRFAPPDGGEGVGLDTVLEKTPGLICRVVQQGGWVALEYPGGQVGGPIKIASSLRFVAEADRFPVRALPDELSGDAKLVLARRLVRERLLQVADPAPNGSGSVHAPAAGK
jgi:ribosomal protein L16 Arg81 hydroxylase